jgi:CTP synthase
LHDAYMSVKEALLHASNAQGRSLEIVWVNSGDLEKGRGIEQLEAVDGIVVPGGFGYRGVEGKIIAARFARERKVPYLGLCLGMQAMCIEFARYAMDLEEANSAEFDMNTPDPVIDLMLEQRGIKDMGGTMRLGLYDCKLTVGSIAAKTYKKPIVQERHRHRFEFNNAYRDAFEDNGMRFSGVNPSTNLVEIAEIKQHPFMLGTQFHPEFLSRPNAPHPLFSAFVKATTATENQPLEHRSVIDD